MPRFKLPAQTDAFFIPSMCRVRDKKQGGLQGGLSGYRDVVASPGEASVPFGTLFSDRVETCYWCQSDRGEIVFAQYEIL